MVYYDLMAINHKGQIRLYLDLLTKAELTDLEVTADLFSALGKIDVSIALAYARETEIPSIPDDKKWLFE